MEDTHNLFTDYSEGEWFISQSAPDIYNLNREQNDTVQYMGTLTSSQADAVLCSYAKNMYRHLLFIMKYIYDDVPTAANRRDATMTGYIAHSTAELLLDMDYSYHKLTDTHGDGNNA